MSEQSAAFFFARSSPGVSVSWRHERAHAVDTATRATALSDTRYRNGLVNQLELPDARRIELANRRVAVQVRGARYDAMIGPIRALGGCWEAAAPNSASVQVRPGAKVR